MSEAAFVERYGRVPEARATAFGRVNLIGEHTDYNGGFVLPTVIPRRTTVLLAARSDRAVYVASDAGDGPVRVAHYQLGEEQRRGTWLDYLQGVTRALLERGHRLPGGVDVLITSTVPLGAGLSSSAALEVAFLRALRGRYVLPLGDVELALVGQRAENELVGAPVGVMDQMAVSVGEPGTALFLDTRDLRWERVPLPGAVELLVIDSGVVHGHATGDYRTRRAECERAADMLGVALLREVTTADLDRVEALPDTLRRRVRHVVTENQRVLDTVHALRAGDMERLGELFAASHRSMRDDYEVSVAAVDAVVSAAHADGDVIGARLTGGGFGGAIVALARTGTAAQAGRRICARAGVEGARVLVAGRE